MQILKTLTLKEIFQDLLWWFLAGDFDSKTTLKICCISSSKYWGIKEKAKIDFGLVRPAKKPGIVFIGKANAFPGAENLINLLSLLKAYKIN